MDAGPSPGFCYCPAGHLAKGVADPAQVPLIARSQTADSGVRREPHTLLDLGV
jgi:hypothetical protein